MTAGGALMARYRVTYAREGTHWVAQVEDPDISTYGRNLAAAKAHAREAIAAYLEVDRVDDSDLDEEVRLANELRQAITDLVAKRRVVEQLEDEVTDQTRQFALRLVRDGFSTRDAGEILGISHQRVAQVVQQDRRASAS
jgi:DNA-directed RNA polymerase specialized sigma subunit